MGGAPQAQTMESALKLPIILIMVFTWHLWGNVASPSPSSDPLPQGERVRVRGRR